MKGYFESVRFFKKCGLLVVALTLALALAGMLAGCGQGSSGSAGSAGTISISLKVDATEGDMDVIFDSTMPVKEDATVYDALIESGLNLDVGSMSGSVYIDGIGGLVASKTSPLSGWLYAVNGEVPSVGADSYVLKDGDEIVWTFYKDAIAQAETE